ncbi:hypothetical protein ACFQY0_18825 [Haloferula chungangensis]|uniref:Uncharacterized protein n=1 Tax=Haloferula chungangensis TaxID=1048331 RepID=A0ABW2LDP8_9BACT
MKLHHTDLEKELLRLARLGSEKNKLKPPDQSSAGAFLRSLGSLVLFVGGVSMLLGIPYEEVRGLHWQTLLTAMLHMFVAHAGSGKLYETATRLGASTVLVNLPIAGIHAARWIRSCYLRRHWLTPLIASVICSFALIESPLDHPLKLVSTSLLLFATTMSSVMLLGDERLLKFRIPSIWQLLFLGLGLLLSILYFTQPGIFLEGNSPRWVAKAITAIAWLYPPTWVLPEALSSGGVLLAAIWISWGFIRWASWPRKIAGFFDTPQDFLGAWGNFGYDEIDDLDSVELEPDNSRAIARGSLSSKDEPDEFVLPEPLSITAKGWVDRWINRCIGLRDRHIAGAITLPNGNYTWRTNLVLKITPIWLLAVAIFAFTFKDGELKDSIILWIWLLTPLIIGLGLFPFTNAISRATSTWYIGEQSILFFSGLPISMRDILRISSKITTARTLIFILIGAPVAAIQLTLLNEDINPWMAFMAVPSIGLTWILSRPVFIWSRLQERSKGRKRAIIRFGLGTLLSIALAFVWLIAGGSSLLSTYFLLVADMGSKDFTISLLLLLGAQTICGLAARATFEIRRWQSNQQVIDWLKPD